jgi:hypothetical protein
MATEKKNVVEEKQVQEKVGIQGQFEKNKVEVLEQEKDVLKTEADNATESKEKVKNISVKLSENIHRKLKAKCAMEGEGTGDMLKRLISNYING